MITVTLHAELATRSYPNATGWIVHDDGQLDIVKAPSTVVASYAPNSWLSAHHAAELTAKGAA